MKAAVLHEVNKPLVIEDVSVPNPGPREVLIRTRVAGLCHSDLHFMEGLYPHPLPAVLGHESAGIVKKVDSDVTYVKPGDHVVTCLSVFCGTCDNCTTGRTVLCTDTTVKMLPGQSSRLSWAREEKLHQFLNLSSFAEQMLVHENAIVKIRNDMPLELAALIGCGVITGYGAVVNTAKVQAGETVAVIPFGQKIELHGFDFLRERRIQGSSMGSNHFRVDMPRLVEFYMRGKLHLEDWISAKLKLSEINEGFANMKAGKTLRSVIMFDS